MGEKTKLESNCKPKMKKMSLLGWNSTKALLVSHALACAGKALQLKIS
ncbi:MAG: hypothetical protein ACI8Z5_001562 [Lentimonas sp.]|jgi:hypothetical protein